MMKIIKSRNQREGRYIGYHFGKHQRSRPVLTRFGIDQTAKVLRSQFFTDGYDEVVTLTVLNKLNGIAFHDTVTRIRPLPQRG